MPDYWGLASIIVKFGLYLGLFGASGMVIVLLVFSNQIQTIRSKIIKSIIGFAIMATLATLIGFSLRGAALTGDASGLTDPEMLGLLWQTSVGDVLASRLIGLGLIMAVLIKANMAPWLALLGVFLTLFSFTQIGHIPDIDAQWLRALLLLHLVGIAFWIGILLPLKWLCQNPDTHSAAAQMGHRFGTLATVIVPALVVAGGIMAYILLGNPLDILSSRYGQFMLGKIVMVAVLLGLAAMNKVRFIPALRAGDHAAGQHLSRVISSEWLLVVGILLATAIFTSVLSLPH
jgi:putative copper resistance protein D